MPETSPSARATRALLKAASARHSTLIVGFEAWRNHGDPCLTRIIRGIPSQINDPAHARCRSMAAGHLVTGSNFRLPDRLLAEVERHIAVQR